MGEVEQPPVAIFLANEPAVYDPGDIITGKVVITLTAEEEVRGVTIKLEGKATVLCTERRISTVAVANTEDEDNSSSDNNSNRDDDASSIFIENTATYVDLKNYYKLCDVAERGKILLPGQTTYDFTFQLPESLPCTFSGKYGKLHYFVHASVQRTYWKVALEAKTAVQIKTVVDLNNDPSAPLPGEWKASKNFGFLCCLSKPLTMDVKVVRRGYCPEETIHVCVTVDNLSNRRINNITVKFVQDTRYVQEKKAKKHGKVMVTRKWGETVESGQTGTWNLEVKVPKDIVPSGLGGCDIIDVQYCLKVEAHVFGVAFNLKQDCQLIVGTVPLKTEELRRDETTSTLVAEAQTLVEEVQPNMEENANNEPNGALYPELDQVKENEEDSNSNQAEEESERKDTQSPWDKMNI